MHKNEKKEKGRKKTWLVWTDVVTRWTLGKKKMVKKRNWMVQTCTLTISCR